MSQDVRILDGNFYDALHRGNNITSVSNLIHWDKYRYVFLIAFFISHWSLVCIEDPMGSKCNILHLDSLPETHDSYAL